MATLGLKEMGKFLWEGREKSLPSWLSQLENAKKNMVFHSKVDAMPLSLKNLLLIRVFHFLIFFGIFSYLYGLIRTYTFIYFWENLPPTRLLGPHAY